MSSVWKVVKDFCKGSGSGFRVSSATAKRASHRVAWKLNNGHIGIHRAFILNLNQRYNGTLCTLVS